MALLAGRVGGRGDSAANAIRLAELMQAQSYQG
jgi:hypothetical protein